MVIGSLKPAIAVSLLALAACGGAGKQTIQQNGNTAPALGETVQAGGDTTNPDAGVDPVIDPQTLTITALQATTGIRDFAQLETGGFTAVSGADLRTTGRATYDGVMLLAPDTTDPDFGGVIGKLNATVVFENSPTPLTGSVTGMAYLDPADFANINDQTAVSSIVITEANLTPIGGTLTLSDGVIDRTFDPNSTADTTGGSINGKLTGTGVFPAGVANLTTETRIVVDANLSGGTLNDSRLIFGGNGTGTTPDGPFDLFLAGVASSN